MELGKYVKEYQETEKKREEEALRAKERERDSRLLNAEVVGKWLADVVAPVFEQAGSQLKEAGCRTDIVWESKADFDYPSSPIKNFALRIDLRTQKPDGEPDAISCLFYEGSFSDRTVRYSTRVVGRSSQLGQNLKISETASQTIEQHVDAFVRAVFGIKAV